MISSNSSEKAPYQICGQTNRFSPATVACVTKVDRESLRVLDQYGSIKTVMPSQISNKIEKRRNAVATDRMGNEVQHGDTVKEVGGENKQGIVVHIHRSYLFLLNREQPENSGIFVIRAQNALTVVAKGGRANQKATSGPDLTKMNPQRQANGGVSSNMPPPRTMGRDRLLGVTVKIRKGPHKGLLGIVKDTTDLEARVELHTKNKTISISKEILGIEDTVSGTNVLYAEWVSRGRGGGRYGGFGGFGGATPRRPDEFAGNRTPMAAANGGRTPASGATRTPAWQSNRGGSSLPVRTPAYNSDSAMAGGRTPGWVANEGGRTSYGGAGSVRTSFDQPFPNLTNNL